MTAPDPARDAARLRALVAVTSTLFWVLSADGQVVEEQPSLQAFTGMGFDRIRGEGWLQTLHPEDRARVQEEWAQHRRLCRPAEIHYRMRRADGEYRYMRARAVPMFDPGQRLLEWVGANEDMTDQRRAIEELRDREARLQQFADSLAQVAWELGGSGETVWINRRFYDYTGLAPDSPWGWDWSRVVHPEDLPAYEAAFERSIRLGEGLRFEGRMRRADGEYRWFQFSSVPQFAQDGSVHRWFGIATDIDDSHQATEKIHRFLATLAHELRNPLAPIANGVQILKMPDLDERTRTSGLATIERQTALMLRLLDDLMDLNRVRSGRLTLQRRPLLLSSVIATALETSRPALEKGHHRLRVNLPPQALSLDADEARLAQVLANVLNNAAKFSPPETPVEVTVTEEPSFARIDVTDQGIGMSPAMLERAFDLFAQADTVVECGYGGLGIGLNVARRLVQMHGGSIEACSAGPGRGSRITIRLPLSGHAAAGEPVPAAEPASTDQSQRRVLVVDDNEDAARIICMLVQTLGHVVRGANSGAEALEIAQHFHPDVAILDIGMPDMSGYELARRLRGQPGADALCLVALTGWGQESDRQKSLEAGFDHHLVKPAGMAALRRILSQPQSGPAAEGDAA